MIKRTLDSNDNITYAESILYKGAKCHPHRWFRAHENHWVKPSCTNFTYVKKNKI